MFAVEERESRLVFLNSNKNKMHAFCNSCLGNLVGVKWVIKPSTG